MPHEECRIAEVTEIQDLPADHSQLAHRTGGCDPVAILRGFWAVDQKVFARQMTVIITNLPLFLAKPWADFGLLEGKHQFFTCSKTLPSAKAWKDRNFDLL